MLSCVGTIALTWEVFADAAAAVIACTSSAVFVACLLFVGAHIKRTREKKRSLPRRGRADGEYFSIFLWLGARCSVFIVNSILRL